MKEKKVIRPACPNCGSTDVAYILWGTPAWSEKLNREIELKQTVLGGCKVDASSERWRCNSCNQRFGNTGFNLLLRLTDIDKLPDYVAAYYDTRYNDRLVNLSNRCACFSCKNKFLPGQIVGRRCV